MWQTPRGAAHAHVVSVDLSHPKVSVNLLFPGDVAQRLPLSAMANERQAVAGVNGDFFNISNTQPGVAPTDAPVGPAIASLLHLKGAVPTAQRFGPSLPAGATVEDVIGVGVDRKGRLGRLVLRGLALTRDTRYDLRGVNQYAIAQNGIGAFNALWGGANRKRATCGTDTRREDPCSTNVHEVVVRRGRVSAINAEPGAATSPSTPSSSSDARRAPTSCVSCRWAIRCSWAITWRRPNRCRSGSRSAASRSCVTARPSPV